MSLKLKITEDKNLALRQRDKVVSNLLGTLLGELDRHPSKPTDEIVLNVIKKMAEGCKLCGEFTEALILESYLPKSLSVRQLFTVIREISATENLTEKKQMGLVMKSLKDKYPNQYDGKLASKIVNRILV